MKCLKPLFASLILYFFIFGCAPEDLDKPITNHNSNKNNAVNLPVKSTNELIIEYKHGMNNSMKNNLRRKYNVKRFEKCDCINDRIEKWEFDPNVDIEGRNDQITQEGGVEGTDYQFFYANENISPTTLSTITSSHSNELITSFLKPNSTLTIAVLDTGINLNKLPHRDPFLYTLTSNEILCKENEAGEEISGWDFINSDNDIYDDNGHGTIVSSIIKSKLDNENITNYQILPVKVFNHLGKTSTFKLLCGYLYTVNKPSVSIINMSFGWYSAPSRLLYKFISENPDILHISSSGNDNHDNDSVAHYPSSYDNNNVLAIGSFSIRNRSEIVKSTFSNYGNTSVDFLSVGDQVSFYDNTGTHYLVSGTSYAAPLVAAKSAIHYLSGYTTPVEITNQLRINGTSLISGSMPTYYGDRIIE
ncbi:S8 family peptidase [Aquimarina muelleri]|uniref:Peptidase S8/S53 domain-containing protein n=1 Tax=Aquimarina muelleri TaxID=279356 RepID=A0A918N2A9_9FLAO|nr:S8 family serine peptidase [Aquimarina muelleri]MCX2762340.1 S8 family serine peptidase [Aquimarina muelleri]GGX03554.1 hypothetical protein GCM10007384_01620 [Aquimarina muelleri]